MICKDCLFFDPEDALTVVCVRVNRMRMADSSPLREDCFKWPRSEMEDLVDEIQIIIDSDNKRFEINLDSFEKIKVIGKRMKELELQYKESGNEH